jgi:hypothetical protein
MGVTDNQEVDFRVALIVAREVGCDEQALDPSPAFGMHGKG